jgi:hypothetical protein
VPKSGDALTPKDAPFGAARSTESTGTHVAEVRSFKARPSEIEFVGSRFLVADERAREAQVLLRFFKVRLDAERLFVMSNG